MRTVYSAAVRHSERAISKTHDSFKTCWCVGTQNVSIFSASPVIRLVLQFQRLVPNELRLITADALKRVER